jgi:preprotein translocase subunit SecY
MRRELARRIAITIGALLVFRLGSHIPVTAMWTQGGSLSTGALARLSIFSLNLVPYLSAAIIIQLLSMVWGRLSSLERSGEAGRQRIARYTLILTLPLAAFQAFGIASAIAKVPGLVENPDGWFLLSATTTMVGGVFVLIWLCELITRHGIGNGLALVLSVSILIPLPADIAAIVGLAQRGVVSGNLVLFHIIFWVAVVGLIVLVEKARRNVVVEFAARNVGRRVFAAQRVVLPIKVNSAGWLIPATVVPWVLTLPLYLAAAVFGSTPWLVAAYEHIQFAKPAHLILGSIVIFVLVFIYTSFVVDPERAAERLDKQGGLIPGVAPGEPTADYLDRAVSLTTVIGAVYLTAVSLIPEALVAAGNMLPYKIGGGSALIVVCTILDLQRQVRDVSLTDPGGERHENNPSGTAGVRQGDPGAAAG